MISVRGLLLLLII